MTVKEFLTISSIATEPEVIRTKLDELKKPYQLGQYKTPDTLNDINLGELLPLSTNTNKGLTRRTAYFDLIQGKLYKIAYKEELHVYKPVICLLYVLRNGISSCYVASLSGYRNGVSHFKLICGNDIQFKLYQKLNSTNYFDIMLECPDNSAGIMEIKAMDDLTVIETTEPLSDWQQIATE